MYNGFLPFLYPCLDHAPLRYTKFLRKLQNARNSFVLLQTKSYSSTELSLGSDASYNSLTPATHLDPPPSDYGRTIFADKAKLTLSAGGGGHGCISFLRDKYISDGPPNGGDGGSGGNIYVQAVRGETSLHKLARRSLIKAGRGKNGQGKGKGGKRGEDVLIQVPVGTVVRETGRVDPVAEEVKRRMLDEGGKRLWSRKRGRYRDKRDVEKRQVDPVSKCYAW